MKETRKLVANFDKRRLHSSIMLHMRRMGIPMSLIGADLLKGVVYGVIRHPDIAIDKALENAIENAKLPGNSMTVDDGYDYIMEVIEIASRPDISGFNRTPESEMEIIQEVVDNIITEIYKEFCYEITVKTLEKNLGIKSAYSIGGELIKCMLFKKLYDPASTHQCMYDYALKKVGAEIEEELTITDVIEYAKAILGENATENDLFELLHKLEKSAYQENKFF